VKEVGERLRTLREGVKLSQAKIAALIGASQVSVNRYESGAGAPPLKTLLWYADYFDVSMDYIFGRTDNPQGRQYDYQPENLKAKMSDKQEWEQFVEMCFDPNSPMSTRLKEALMQMAGDKK
jgi:transcriptional regulator with XRE-family HTH domain